MKKYYLNYDEKADINYSLLFAFYIIATTDKDEKINSVIKYKSLSSLSKQIEEKCDYNISSSTLSRALNNAKYLPYFSKSKEEKAIVLNNNFKKGKAASNKFVVLIDKEISFLLKKNDNLLIKYYLYLKYYCGYSKTKTIDSTANQILSAMGYSANCGNNKYKLCQYNAILAAEGFITIKNTIDANGRQRNIYRINI